MVTRMEKSGGGLGQSIGVVVAWDHDFLKFVAFKVGHEDIGQAIRVVFRRPVFVIKLYELDGEVGQGAQMMGRRKNLGLEKLPEIVDVPFAEVGLISQVAWKRFVTSLVSILVVASSTSQFPSFF